MPHNTSRWIICYTGLMVLLVMFALPELFTPEQSATADAASVIYVDADAIGSNNGLNWANAFTLLQNALLVAGSGDEIWVAEGVYYPDQGTGQINGDRTSTFALKADVAIYGGFASGETSRDERDWAVHITVLSGDIDGNDITDVHGVVTDTNNIVGVNANHVVKSSGGGITNTARLDGFTITAGQGFDCLGASVPEAGGGMIIANGSTCSLEFLIFRGNFANQAGGGMLIEFSTPTLSNITFCNNTANSWGGGMYIYVSDPLLSNVVISDNTADSGGGLVLNNQSSPVLRDVIITGNSAVDAGGMFLNYLCDPLLDHVTFTDNTASWKAGGMYLFQQCDPTLINVTFSGNTGDESGAMLNNDHSNPTVINGLFFGNTAIGAAGGAVCNDNQSSPALINCTIYGNYAEWGGGGIGSLDQSNPSITNCIVWGNTCGTTGHAQVFNVTSVPFIANSDIMDLWQIFGTFSDGGGNLEVNPLFVNTATNDFHLSHLSPLLNAGNNAYLPADTYDLDDDGNATEPIPYDFEGHSRILNSITEMGVYEIFFIIGSVPDGRTGTPLHISRNSVTPSMLDFTWGASCGKSGADYAIFEGPLGTWYNHYAILCSTSGALSATVTQSPGNRYYFVVPLSANQEGSYGTNSAGEEIPWSDSPCRSSQDLTPCP